MYQQLEINGLEKANGKYIYFIDGDDLVTPNALSKILNVIEKRDYDIIGSNFIKIYRKEDVDKKINENKKKEDIEMQNKIYPHNIIYLFEKRKINLSLCCNIINKKVIEQNKLLLNENVKYTEDMDFCLECYMKSKKISYINFPIYAYRQSRCGSATSLYTKKRIIDTFDFFKKWISFLKENNIDKKMNEEIEAFMAYQYSIIVGLIYLLDEKDKTKIKNQIKPYKNYLKLVKGKKGKIIYISYKIFGFEVTGKIMAMWIKYKDFFKRR